MNFRQFGKAAFAFVVAVLGALTTVLVGDVGLGDLSAGQWVSAVLAGVVAAGGVWQLPYVPSRGSAPAPPSGKASSQP